MYSDAFDYSTIDTTMEQWGNYMHLITQGGDVKFHFHGNLSCSGLSGEVHLAIYVNEAPVAKNDGHFVQSVNPDSKSQGREVSIAFTETLKDLPPGLHRFYLVASVNTNTGTWYTDGRHPQLWAREVSRRGAGY